MGGVADIVSQEAGSGRLDAATQREATMALKKLFLMAALVLGAAACDGDVVGVTGIPRGYRVGAPPDTTLARDSIEQARPHRKLELDQ
jgi:hypothetical protein